MPQRKKLSNTVLKEAGYKNKLKELTKAERDEMSFGIPVELKDGTKGIREGRDFRYWYKKVGDVEVKIYIVGDKLYYGSGWARYADQLKDIEKHAQENAHWEYLQTKVEDTEPVDLSIFSQPSERLPDEVMLKGGPFDGCRVFWNLQYPFFMQQFKSAGKTLSARYSRAIEADESIYLFEKYI